MYNCYLVPYTDYMTANPMFEMNPMMYMMEEFDPAEQAMNNMYPKEYYLVYPQVCKYCDMMEEKYGKMYYPTEKEIESMSDEIYDKVKDKLDEIYEDDESESRRRRYGRRRGIGNLARSLFIREGIGRRRRRRCRRCRKRPYYGYGYGYAPWHYGYGYSDGYYY